MQLFPIINQHLTNQIASEIIPQLWAKHGAECEGKICYGVYFNYLTDEPRHREYDFAICTEKPTACTPIEITDFTFYEVFHCKSVAEVYPTWEMIWRKTQQGLLKRAYTVDFEKYLPDGTVEIYVAVEPHC